MQDKKQGRVKFFNSERGFGFISYEDVDYFVHITNVEGDLLVQEEVVEFVPVESRKGLQAIQVCRIQPPEMVEEEGIVKSFNLDKGYGFIAREDRADVFAHISDVKDSHSLREGDKVLFQVRRARAGRDRAYNIRLVE